MKSKGLMWVVFLLGVINQALAAPSYTDNGDETVTDNNTGLIWQKSDDDVQRNWQQALDYCNGLSLGGKTDWRLPNIKELLSVVDLSTYDPAIDTTNFPGVLAGVSNSYYWSSSYYSPNPVHAWYVTFYTGGSNYTNKTSNYYVRCVY